MQHPFAPVQQIASWKKVKTNEVTFGFKASFLEGSKLNLHWQVS